MSGLRVSRTERALSTSPTLRSLVKFTNPSTKAISVTVLWDSAMGADGSGGTRTSSAGPLGKMTTADHWVVASDDPTTLSDTPVTWVFFGPGSPQFKVAADVSVPEVTPSTDIDCVVVRYKSTVPGNSTRYLLFFTELHDPTALVTAINDAQKFNHVAVGSALMTGIPQSVASKILNWDF